MFGADWSEREVKTPKKLVKKKIAIEEVNFVVDIKMKNCGVLSLQSALNMHTSE